MKYYLINKQKDGVEEELEIVKVRDKDVPQFLKDCVGKIILVADNLVEAIVKFGKMLGEKDADA